MYHYVPPQPLVIDLSDMNGYNLRVKSANFVEKVLARGKEAGSPTEQSYGILAEMTIRKELGLPDKKIDDPRGHYKILCNNSQEGEAKTFLVSPSNQGPSITLLTFYFSASMDASRSALV